MKRKQMQKGIEQLAEEGTVQLFLEPGREKDPILGVVGELQFEVLKYRLEHEYGAKVEMERLALRHARWVDGPDDAGGDPQGAHLARRLGRGPAPGGAAARRLGAAPRAAGQSELDVQRDRADSGGVKAETGRSRATGFHGCAGALEFSRVQSGNNPKPQRIA